MTEEITTAEFLAQKRHKYGAVPTTVDGIRFASKAEARRYQELKLLEQGGTISGLTLQPRYVLVAGITYVGDFAYHEGAQCVCEDVKGVMTEVFRLKAKLFRHFYPEVELRVTGQRAAPRRRAVRGRG